METAPNQEPNHKLPFFTSENLICSQSSDQELDELVNKSSVQIVLMN